MTEIKFDRELAAKAYDLITEKYATEGGKKFIFHLISSFVVPSNYKVRQMTLEDAKNYKVTECCITKAKIAPIDVMVPQEEGTHYYGWVTDGSNKIVSVEGMLALQEFIKKRLELGDDAIAKIHKYINRHQQQQQPAKNGSRYQPHPSRKEKGGNKVASKGNYSAADNLPRHKRNEGGRNNERQSAPVSEAPRYYPKATMGDVIPDHVKEQFAQLRKIKLENKVKREKVTLDPKEDKGSKASYIDTEALPDRVY